MEILRITYKTPKGIILTGYVVQTINGYKPVYFNEGVLDKTNEILKLEQVADMESFKSEIYT